MKKMRLRSGRGTHLGTVLQMPSRPCILLEVRRFDTDFLRVWLADLIVT